MPRRSPGLPDRHPVRAILGESVFEALGLDLLGRDRLVRSISRQEGANGRGLAGWLRRYAPGAECREGFAPNKRAVVQIVEFLKAKRLSFDLPLELRGTDFQLAVWNALRDIPYGETRTYGDISAAVGNPNANRAVGNANGSNPVALVVPCHRVVASGGKLGGYGGGATLKKRLLAMEKATTTLEPRLL